MESNIIIITDNGSRMFNPEDIIELEGKKGTIQVVDDGHGCDLLHLPLGCDLSKLNINPIDLTSDTYLDFGTCSEFTFHNGRIYGRITNIDPDDSYIQGIIKQHTKINDLTEWTEFDQFKASINELNDAIDV